ncbi:hypothetical protein LCGC14_1900840 [marine sediment metagenome]|uniref:Uncharacterized protein n=1 Tax=marine sediment metagenome TaxID=412755 RepID=A0A0F9FWP3_9ZZZZ
MIIKLIVFIWWFTVMVAAVIEGEYLAAVLLAAAIWIVLIPRRTT